MGNLFTCSPQAGDMPADLQHGGKDSPALAKGGPNQFGKVIFINPDQKHDEDAHQFWTDIKVTPKTRKSLKINVFGASKVGKTTLVFKGAKNQLPSPKQMSSEYLDFQALELLYPPPRTASKNGLTPTKVILQLWEFKGGDSTGLKGTDGVVLMYDVTDKTSLTEVIEIWKKVREGVGRRSTTKTEDKVPVILFGNKRDICETTGNGNAASKDGHDEEKQEGSSDEVKDEEESAKKSREITTVDGRLIAAKEGFTIFTEGSANEGKGILSALAKLVEVILAEEEVVASY